MLTVVAPVVYLLGAVIGTPLERFVLLVFPTTTRDCLDVVPSANVTGTPDSTKTGKTLIHNLQYNNIYI